MIFYRIYRTLINDIISYFEVPKFVSKSPTSNFFYNLKAIKAIKYTL